MWHQPKHALWCSENPSKIPINLGIKFDSPQKWRGWLCNDPWPINQQNPPSSRVPSPSSQGTVSRLPELLRKLLHHGLSCWIWGYVWHGWCFGAPPMHSTIGEFWYHQIGNKNGSNFTSNEKIYSPQKRLNDWTYWTWKMMILQHDFTNCMYIWSGYSPATVNTFFRVWIYIWKTNSPNSNETIKRALEARGKASLLRIYTFPQKKTLRSETRPVFLRSFNA